MEAKKTALLNQYFNKSDQHDDSITKLKDFIVNPQGNTLFNKILRILDDSPPDADLMNQLSSALAHIVQSDFASMFDAHRYALSQIERISPPALAILADSKNWPTMQIGSFEATGSRITSDWLSEFAQAYSLNKGITDSAIKSRIRFSINEIINLRMVEAHTIANGQANVKLTEIGRLLMPYLVSDIQDI